MMFGLSLHAFTVLHTVLSLIGILAGLLAVPALAAGRWLSRLQSVFLWTTAATTLTGFQFPFGGFTPAIGVGIISTVVIAIAFFALYARGRQGGAGRTYAIAALTALYLNLFVLVVQAFQKILVLNALAPTGTEGPFVAAQAVLLIGTLAFGIRMFRSAKAA